MYGVFLGEWPNWPAWPYFSAVHFQIVGAYLRDNSIVFSKKGSTVDVLDRCDSPGLEREGVVSAIVGILVDTHRLYLCAVWVARCRYLSSEESMDIRIVPIMFVDSFTICISWPSDWAAGCASALSSIFSRILFPARNEGAPLLVLACEVER